MSDKTRLAVFISGRGSLLFALHRAIASGELAAEIRMVICDQARAAGLQKARDIGLPSELVERKKYASRAAFEARVNEVLASMDVDLIVLAGFMRVLSAEFVKPHAGRIINIHPSLLPKYRGLHTHDRVVAAGDALHGTSVHYVIAELDAGPIILQKAIRMLEDEDAERLAARLLPHEHRCLTHAVGLISAGRVRQAGAGTVLYDGKLLPPNGIYYGPDQEVE